MKVRNDYVSNSSSCSFIIHVANEDDLKQLSKPKVRAVLKRWASVFSSDINQLPYGDCLKFYDISDIQVGDFIHIYAGEDSEYDWEYSDPLNVLYNIIDNLNDGYGKLNYYNDATAHVSIGDEYRKKQGDQDENQN